MLYFQNKCQEEINELQVLKSSLQSKLVVEKDKVSSTKAEKEAIEDILNSERSLIASLRNEVTQLKVCLILFMTVMICTRACTLLAGTVKSFEPRNGNRKAITFKYLTKYHQGTTSVKVID